MRGGGEEGGAGDRGEKTVAEWVAHPDHYIVWGLHEAPVA